MHKKKLWWGKTSEYTPLKWIQGDGRTQYIRFDGIFPKADDAIEVVVEAKEFGAGGYAHVYGAGNATNNANAVNCLILPSGGNGGRFLGKTYSGFLGALDTKYVIYEDGTTQTYNGTKQTDTGEASGQADKNPLTLFRHGATPSDSSQLGVICGVLRISALRMWNKTTGKMILDVVPVLDKEGVPCMWDRVNNELYYNQGTGYFTYEEWDITPCDCVYTDGNAYTSTMWNGDSDTKMEMVFDIAEQTSNNTGSMGSRGTSANNQVLAIGYGASTLATDFNNSSYRQYRSYVVYETNKKYRVYTSKEKRSIVDEDTGVVLDENTTLCTDTLATDVLLLGAERGVSARHKGNIYGAKVWEGATLIRDYIPVVDGDNKGCFYDKTLNTLRYSVGSSDFVGHFVENGVDYKVVSYITAEQVPNSPTSTSNCAFIKTGYIPAYSKKTRMKLKAKMQVKTTSYEHFLGGTSVGGARFVVGQAGGQNKWYFGLGAQNFWLSVLADTDEHIFGLDWKTKTCSIDDETYSFTSSGEYDSTVDFWLNARNNPNYQDANRQGGSDTTYLKFYEDKKLAYNGIPVVRTSDDKAGLFETVNREFQTTAGTVEYTYTEQEAA